MKYYIIAGEASGDMHGSNLMKGIYEKDKEADIRFWGGNLMKDVYDGHQTGTGLVHDYKEGAVIGFMQVILHAGRFLKRFRDCCSDIMQWNPDVVILIDYPGFNFRIAEFAHKHGLKTFYYIAPKVWASRERRVKKIKAYVDKLFIIFPFEIPYFTEKDVQFIYKGNPLIDAVDNSPAMQESRNDFLERTGMEDKPFIALLPGSRNGEIKTMMPVFMEFADKMIKIPEYSGYNFLIAGAPSRTTDDYAPYIRGRENYVRLIFDDSYAIIRNSEAAVVNSGTASLETAIIGTPQVVAYKSSPINFMIAKKIIRIKFISLGNLILNRLCFRELLQYYFDSGNVLGEIRRILEDESYRNHMLSDYKEIREALGGKGASFAVAESMIEAMKD
ncbi:MAG: lipid-A-disaccharide synthase [Bacteroidales bacterium]|jgi:lipid-A-disaccharide synthase|nr:lipid-A-disaccharide synthase [Bacteroidales bacterium]MCI1786128.1 lipid-A-disaccharide synthase [Bacteroidales bacterium]